MKEPTPFVQSMLRAKAAVIALGAAGFVVIGWKCGNYNPVITIDPPTDKKILSSAPVIAVREGMAESCSHIQIAKFKECLVEWSAPEELVNKYYKSYKLPEIAGFELAEDGQSHD